MMRRFAVLACLVCAVPLSLPAQAAIAGTWFTEFDTQVRIMNGVESSAGKGHARIELQVTGDSIHGTWQTLGATGAPDGPPRLLAGTLTSAGVHIEALKPSEIVTRVMESETHTQAMMNYTVALHGDSLVGTEQWVAVDHSSQGPARRFTATRKQS
jgi:hypothetical protein